MGITKADLDAQRAMLKRGEEKRKADRKQAERERLRDTFAAAALTGYTTNPAWDDVAASIVAEQAYADADEMLRERDKQSVGVSEMDSESDRKSVAAHGACARSCSQPFDSAPITQPAPPSVETDGFSPGSRTGQINRTPERESPRRECGESSLRDVPQPDNGRAAGGPEHKSPIDVEELLSELHYIAGSGDHVEYDIRRTACEAEHAIDRLRAWVNELQLSKAEIDALRRVVENGRFIDMSDYGHLRSLLVRLRPEWEQDEPDRLKPVKEAASDRPEPIKIDLSQPCMVDPPSGWKWGFPRRYDPAEDGPMKEWLIRNGYPKHFADNGLNCTFTVCDKEPTGK